MGSVSSRVACPKCKNFKSNNGEKLLEHVNCVHTISCTTCGLYGFSSQRHLDEHFEKVHTQSNRTYQEDSQPEQFPDKVCKVSITCPRCNKDDLTDGKEFVKHLITDHSFASQANIRSPSSDLLSMNNGNKRLPQVGDKILAMWSESRWQYFHATIIGFFKDMLKYEIDWDDGDTTGRVVDYYNIAVDRVPEQNEIGVGSVILFPQGSYRAGATQLTGGLRWHQGIIKKIYKRNGETFYDGCHTKGTNDGKFVTYKDYNYEFNGKELKEFRVGPNVFDILEESDDHSTGCDDIDIYFSYTKNDIPPNKTHDDGVKTNLICDPTDIVTDLKQLGLNVVEGTNDNTKNNLKEKVTLMKNSKVFVACISDEYVLNEQCRMEFQYAKSSLRKPTVPLVLGDGMEWTMSVVGMLIAGELYIHFKDKTVHDIKCQEMLKSLSRHIKTKDGHKLNSDQIIDESPRGDVFISYCWSNSHQAMENNEINECIGTKYSDPRMIQKKISDIGYSTWLDVEKLKSAHENAGLFEQLSVSLKNAKVIVAFISSEYAKSVNCQMEFQFAIKTLRKPIIPVVVGTGNEWKYTSVGMLIETSNVQPICIQGMNSEDGLKKPLEEISKRLNEFTNGSSAVEDVQATERSGSGRRVPQPGDHVISHHFKYCYYMATVVGYNISTMEYTVDWDDGDPTGRIQKYDQVALDDVPDFDVVGVGSIVFFPQGSYGATAGNNSGGERYHEGVITRVTKEGQNYYFDGHHTRGENDGKHCSFRGYEFEFRRVPLENIRKAPTALDTVGR